MVRSLQNNVIGGLRKAASYRSIAVVAFTLASDTCCMQFAEHIFTYHLAVFSQFLYCDVTPAVASHTGKWPLYFTATADAYGGGSTLCRCAFTDSLLALQIRPRPSTRKIRVYPEFSMPSPRSSVERLFNPRRSSDAEIVLSEPPEPPESPSQRASSPEPTSLLTSLTPSPQPPKPAVCVELRILSPSVKKQYATDLSERVLTFAEQFPESEMRYIIGEYQAGSQLFYFVKLSEDTAFRVRT